MKWFDTWFCKKVKWAWDQAHTNDSLVFASEEDCTLPTKLNSNTSITFRVHPAAGGFVVEHSYYQYDKDSRGPGLTIVNRDQDLGQALAHIVTLESLHR